MPYFERNFREPDQPANPEAELKVRMNGTLNAISIQAPALQHKTGFNSGNTIGTE
jgi:hypothetical protein